MESPHTIKTDMSEEVMADGIRYVMYFLMHGCKGNKALAALLARAAYASLTLNSFDGNYAAAGEALKARADEDADEMQKGAFDLFTSTTTIN